MPSPRRAVDYRVDPFDLRLFTAVLELGTITAAAQAAGLSLAAASTRLKALEGRVGTRLLDRAKAGATPTAAGRAMAQRAHGVLAELESLHVEMGRFAAGLRGTVRLLGNTAALAHALPPRLGRFLARHADIDVDLQELPSEGVIDGLRRGAGDVGVAADHVDTGGLVVHPWVDDELVALVPRGHGGRGRAVAFADLLTLPFVGPAADSGLGRFLAQQARRGGRPMHHRVRVGGFDAAAQLVAAGAGVAVMPRSAAARSRAEPARVMALKDAWARRRLLVCTTPEAAARPGVQALVEALLPTAG